MAVGITIVSGARQGERLEFDLPEFRAGSDRSCQVYFDPERDRAARGREAQFRLDNDGWSVKNVGGGQLQVNDRLIEGSSRLRSGDVVRLSPAGPDFIFNLLARLSVVTTPEPEPVSAPPGLREPSPPVATEPDAGAGQGWDSRRIALAAYRHGQGPEARERRPQDDWDPLDIPVGVSDALDALDEPNVAPAQGWDDLPSVGKSPRSPTISQLTIVLAVSALVVIGVLALIWPWKRDGAVPVPRGLDAGGAEVEPIPVDNSPMSLEIGDAAEETTPAAP